MSPDMNRVEVRPAGPIRGEINVPGDKSLSHRALMFSALCGDLVTAELLLGHGVDVTLADKAGLTALMRAAELIDAYHHYYHYYSGSPLLVIDRRHLDFLERPEDFEELVHRLRQPVKGTQYFVPLGSR